MNSQAPTVFVVDDDLAVLPDKTIPIWSGSVSIS